MPVRAEPVVPALTDRLALRGVTARKLLICTLRANGPGTLGLCVLLRGFEGFVEGGFADLEARGGLANCEAGSDMFARLAELVRCDHWPPPTGATSLASGLEARSEEHTSELQSLMRISYAVFCLKTKNKTKTKPIQHSTKPTP